MTVILRRDLEAIVDDLAFSQNITTDLDEVEGLLGIIQDFDPAGVAATSLQECLVLQLERKDSNPTIRLAIRILKEQFDAFSKKHYDKLIRSLEIEEDELKYAIDEILKLNPKPGSAFGGTDKSQQYIVPGFYHRNEGWRIGTAPQPRQCTRPACEQPVS